MIEKIKQWSSGINGTRTRIKSEPLAEGEPSINKVDPYERSVALSADQLLASPYRAKKILLIKREMSVTDAIWSQHYLYSIKRFAELVQGAPASEYHHHNYHGGLLDHTLDVLAAGVQVSLGQMLPPNVAPEDQHGSVDKWRFGVVIAILAHDLGKIVTDIDFVYESSPKVYTPWHPWFDLIPLGCEYKYRYRKRVANSQAGKGLHEKSAMSLVPRLLTKEAAAWLFSDQELISQLFSTVSQSTFGGGAIAGILKDADMNSVRKNLGGREDRPAVANQRMAGASRVGLEEKVLVTLRELLANGSIRRNSKGGGVWITEELSWVSGNMALSAVQESLNAAGVSGVPQNVWRLAEVLLENNLILPNAEGGHTWAAMVRDYQVEWNQKLSFLCFKNDILWPAGRPAVFEGEITPDQDAKIAPSTPNATTDTQVPLNDVTVGEGAAPLAQESKDQTPIISQPKVKPVFVSTLGTAKGTATDTPVIRSTKPVTQNASPSPVKTDLTETIPSPTTSAVEPSMPVIEVKPQHRGKKDLTRADIITVKFFEWLFPKIQSRKIKVNEPNAQLHIHGDYVAMVSPKIFNTFLGKSVSKSIYAKARADTGDSTFAAIQKEIFALGIHKVGKEGRGIINLKVRGDRSESSLTAILIPRRYFPELANYRQNPAIIDS